MASNLDGNRPVGRPKGSKNFISEKLMQDMIDNNAPEEMTQMILEMIRNRESMSNKDKIAFINWYTKTFVISAEKQVDADIASVESVNKDELMEMLNGLIPKETDV